MQEDKIYSRYEVPVNPSYYDLLRDGEENHIEYKTTEHLPRFPITFKDLPMNIANRLRDIKVGDSLIFVCDKKRMKDLREEQKVEYEQELEKVVTAVEFDPLQHVRKIFFKP